MIVTSVAIWLYRITSVLIMILSLIVIFVILLQIFAYVGQLSVHTVC